MLSIPTSGGDGDDEGWPEFGAGCAASPLQEAISSFSASNSKNSFRRSASIGIDDAVHQAAVIEAMKRTWFDLEKKNLLHEFDVWQSYDRLGSLGSGGFGDVNLAKAKRGSMKPIPKPEPNPNPNPETLIGTLIGRLQKSGHQVPTECRAR